MVDRHDHFLEDAREVVGSLVFKVGVICPKVGPQLAVLDLSLWQRLLTDPLSRVS